jgi:glycerol-3-phosphate acyltransferase PlsY
LPVDFPGCTANYRRTRGHNCATAMSLLILFALGIGYLIGSVPFGLVLTRIAGGGDIRKIGSGNIGATNVLRTGRKGLALATLVLDSGKGAIALFAAYWIWGTDAAVWAGAGAIVGHCFPVWLRGEGGKGVATALGTLLAAAWPIGIMACLTWLLTALVFRISSLAALVALASAPAWTWLFGWRLDQWEVEKFTAKAPEPDVIVWFADLHGGTPVTYHQLALMAGAVAVLVWFRHGANIRRLLRGKEPRIGKGKVTDPTPPGTDN